MKKEEKDSAEEVDVAQPFELPARRSSKK